LKIDQIWPFYPPGIHVPYCKLVSFNRALSDFRSSKDNFFSFSGSIPLDPSLAQSLEDGQAFIDLFPNSPTLDAVNAITSKLLQMESNGDQ